MVRHSIPSAVITWASRPSRRMVTRCPASGTPTPSCLPADADDADRVDGAVDLHRRPGQQPSGQPPRRWRSGRPGPGTTQPGHVAVAEPGRHALEVPAGAGQVHHGGVDPERDDLASPVRPEPELLPTDREVPARWHGPLELTAPPQAPSPPARQRVPASAASSAAASTVGGSLVTSPGGTHSGNPGRGGAGANRSAGVAMPSDWCGRIVLYSTRHASTASCAAATVANGGASSSSSRWMRLVPALHLPRRGRGADLGQQVLDPVHPTDPVEQHLRWAAACRTCR